MTKCFCDDHIANLDRAHTLCLDVTYRAHDWLLASTEALHCWHGCSAHDDSGKLAEATDVARLS